MKKEFLSSILLSAIVVISASIFNSEKKELHENSTVNMENR